MSRLWVTLGVLFLVSGCAIIPALRGQKMNNGIERDKTGYQLITSDQDVAQVYPLTVDEIKTRCKNMTEQCTKEINAIATLQQNQQNKQTVIYALDSIVGYVSALMGELELIHMVSPDKEVREAGSACIQELEKLYNTLITGNKKLYQVLKQYQEGQAHQDNLTQEELYFLTELIDDLKRAGLELPDNELQKVLEVKNKLTEITNQFEVNIANANVQLELDLSALKGLPESFIKTLKKTEEGKYILRGNYPTQDMVMKECAVVETRKKFLQMMNKRAYPENKAVLEQMITLRRELAQLLGFASYADLSLAGAMVDCPAKAWKLQEDLLPKALKKAETEIELLKTDLPEGVELTKDGKFQPWDLAYAINYYKKKYYQVDEQKLAEYFPMQETIDGLFAIYEKFFDLKFETIACEKTWHPEVQLLKVRKNQGQLLGYVFLDMFPRDNKYSHAAKFSAIAPHKSIDDVYYPGVCTVVCNFTPATQDKPSLLNYNEVNTFFHEFGHALHFLLGGTQLVTQAGTNVKRDFVEMPSQMLENWLEDKAIVQQLGKHYQTGEKIPDELITKKLELLTFTNGYAECRQICLGMMSLDYFDATDSKDLDAVIKMYHEKASPLIVFDPENKMYASFGHLGGYGPKYYGYLWTRILSTDLFEVIEQEGLLNQEAGKRYSKHILEPGGSKDPAQLVREYLGREPNQKAFLKKNKF